MTRYRPAMAFLALASVMISAVPAIADSVTRIPPLRIAEPDWLPMNGPEIIASLSGRTIRVDDKYEPFLGAKVVMSYFGGCPPLEMFAAGGKWQKYECQVGPRYYEGSWSVEPFRGGEHLCVEAPDRKKECRFVWQGATPDLFIMRIPESGEVRLPRIENYLAYRIIVR